MERLQKLAEVLMNQGYMVRCFASKEDAVMYLDRELDQKVIGIGGSQTVRQMGLFSSLETHNTVYWHDEKPENMTVAETRRAAACAPVYISSVNAVSENGDIVNIDATGNRVAAISFGPEDIYLIIGKNKITEDYESAVFRARNVAAPLNAKRLHRNTPCALNADRCYDCRNPERICRIFSVLRCKPAGARYHVILINEDLGY